MAEPETEKTEPRPQSGGRWKKKEGSDELEQVEGPGMPEAKPEAKPEPQPASASKKKEEKKDAI